MKKSYFQKFKRFQNQYSRIKNLIFLWFEIQKFKRFKKQYSRIKNLFEIQKFLISLISLFLNSQIQILQNFKIPKFKTRKLYKFLKLFFVHFKTQKYYKFKILIFKNEIESNNPKPKKNIRI